IHEAVLERDAVGAVLHGQRHHRRLAPDHRKEGERREVRHTISRQPADPTDRARDDGGDQELVDVFDIECVCIKNHLFSLRLAACSLRKYVGSSSSRRLLPIVCEKKMAAAIGRWWIATCTIALVVSRVSTVTPLNCTPACASATHSRYCLAPT